MHDVRKYIHIQDYYLILIRNYSIWVSETSMFSEHVIIYIFITYNKHKQALVLNLRGTWGVLSSKANISKTFFMRVRVRVCACVRACARAYQRACARTCVRTCARAI